MTKIHTGTNFENEESINIALALGHRAVVQMRALRQAVRRHFGICECDDPLCGESNKACDVVPVPGPTPRFQLKA